MFKKLRNNIGAVILITILGLILLGATYVNLGPTSLIDGDIGVTAGHSYYIGGELAVHTQNTDTGTTSTTFQIDSGNLGPKIKNNSGTLEVRNEADDAYADLRALSYYGDGSNLTDVGSATATGLTIDAKEENTGSIVKGQPVYNSGSAGVAISLIGLADCDDPAKYHCIGIAAEAISKNGNGTVRVGGVLTGVDSDGVTAINPNGETWVASDILYLDDTAGGLTNVKPTVGHVVEVGHSLFGSSNTDAILVHLSRPRDGIRVATGEDIELRLGDSAGVNKIIIKDYANNPVGSWDSDGNIDGTSLTLDTALAAIEGGTGKATITENSFLKGGAGNTYIERTYAEVKDDLGIDLSLYYLKTEMDSFSELQAIISDKTLINEEDAIILDNDLVFEGFTADEFETTFTITDPTADRTIVVPDSDQTIGTATSIQDNLILKADLAEEDWGDVNITAGNVAEVQDLTIANEAQGDILYFNGTNWIRLAKGTAGQVLTMNVGATAPEWQTP